MQFVLLNSKECRPFDEHLEYSFPMKITPVFFPFLFIIHHLITEHHSKTSTFKSN